MNREIIVLRETVVKLTQLLTGMGLAVTQQGTNAYVQVDQRTQKPIRINIPHIPDNASVELLHAIQGFVDHEVAHVLFTDWAVVKKSNARGEKFNLLRNLLEDTFIEREMAKKFPGSAHNVKQLHKFFIAEITKPALAAAKGPQDEFGILLVPLVRALSGQQIFKDFMADHMEQPLIKALMEQLPAAAIASIPKIKKTQDSYDLADVFYQILNPPPPPAPPSKGDGEDKSDSKQCNPKGKGDEGKPQQPPKPEEEDEDEDDQAQPPKSEDEKNEDEDAGAPSEDEDEDEDGNGAGDGDDEEDGDEGEDEKPQPKPSKAQQSDDDEDGDEEEDEGASGSGDDGDEDADDEGDEGEEEDGDKGAAGGSGDEDQDESDEDDADGQNAGMSAADEEGPEEGDDVVKARDEDEAGDEDSKGNPNANPFQGGVDLQATQDFDAALADKIRESAAKASYSADYRIFTRDFDRIENAKIDERYQDQWLVDLDDTTRGMVGLMQKDIERMMASRSLSVKVPGYRSGRLNSSGLHRLMAGDDRVFRRKHEQRSIETAVGVLIDNSGSMQGAKMRIAMCSGYAFSQTLDRVGIKHEVIGFTTGDHADSKGFSLRMIQLEEQRLGE